MYFCHSLVKILVVQSEFDFSKILMIKLQIQVSKNMLSQTTNFDNVVFISQSSHFLKFATRQ